MSEPIITFYWRPGCVFCFMLERNLRMRGLALDKRNIWDDPEAAAAVREAANGNETVPTISVGNVTFVNPSGAEVAAYVTSLASEE